MFRSNFRLPHMCARCGSLDPTEMHPVSTTPIFGFQLPALGTKTYKFNVPVCSSCHQTLRGSKTLTRMIGAISIIMGGVIGNLTDTDGSRLVLGIFLGLVVGVALEILIEYIMFTNLGSYNGMKFKFRNQEFMKAFKDINPHLS